LNHKASIISIISITLIIPMSNQTIRSRRNQPFIWIDLAIDDLGLTVDEFRVYVHLCRRAGKDGNAFPNYASIGEHCFRADSPSAKNESLRRRAIRTVAKLLEKGLIGKGERVGNSGQDVSNIYWINDLKDFSSDSPVTPAVTPQSPPSDSPVTPPVTPQSPLYIEIDPLETDPNKHPPTPQRGDESEPVIAELILESESAEPYLTTGKLSKEADRENSNLGEDRYSALAPVDPFLNRRSGLSYQKEKALTESLAGSPFESIAEQDDFYAKHLDYIRATSPKLDPGQITGIAKASLKRIMAGIPDPEDRRVLVLWQSGQLGKFEGLEYSKEAIDKAQRRAKGLEILEKLEKGEDLYA
jgi:hypothetical protein